VIVQLNRISVDVFQSSLFFKIADWRSKAQAKSSTFEAKAKAKAFKPMARAEIKMRHSILLIN